MLQTTSLWNEGPTETDQHVWTEGQNLVPITPAILRVVLCLVGLLFDLPFHVWHRSRVAPNIKFLYGWEAGMCLLADKYAIAC
jgi:hypothetical protein